MSTTYKLHVKKEKIDEVESFIEEYGSIFHSYKYLNTVGTDYCCVIAESQAKGIVGALPLVKTTRHSLKAYHIPPYTYQFGPVLHRDLQEKEHKVVQQLLENLPKSGHYEFKSFLPKQDVLPFKKLGFSVSVLQTHLIVASQPFGIEDLNNSKRREIQKLMDAEQKGRIKILENKPSNLEVIQKLWQETALRAGFNPKKVLVNKIFNADFPAYHNLILDRNDSPLCGSFCLMDRSKMYHLISANRRIEDKLLSKANVLALYKSIEYANQNGLTFDTEGSSIPGIAKFYRYMGAQPKFIYRIQKSPSFYYQFVRWLAQLKREYGRFSSLIFTFSFAIHLSQF